MTAQVLGLLFGATGVSVMLDAMFDSRLIGRLGLNKLSTLGRALHGCWRPADLGWCNGRPGIARCSRWHGVSSVRIRHSRTDADVAGNVIAGKIPGLDRRLARRHPAIGVVQRLSIGCGSAASRPGCMDRTSSSEHTAGLCVDHLEPTRRASKLFIGWALRKCNEQSRLGLLDLQRNYLAWRGVPPKRMDTYRTAAPPT